VPQLSRRVVTVVLLSSTAVLLGLRLADYPGMSPTDRWRNRQSVGEKSITKDDEMNSDILQGKWRQLKGEARTQWGKLTDDDLDQVQGQAEKLVGLVQERYGYNRDQAQREVDTWVQRYGSTVQP
jgi:uncharacterized protein YjbJ (UPF0337 family)